MPLSTKFALSEFLTTAAFRLPLDSVPATATAKNAHLSYRRPLLTVQQETLDYSLDSDSSPADVAEGVRDKDFNAERHNTRPSLRPETTRPQEEIVN